MKKTLFIKNAAYLTASSLILRFAGIIFKIWLAAKIGAEGMGLYQLVFSLFLLASCFSQGALPTAITRLTAEEEALGSKSGIKKIVKSGLKINLVISLVTGAFLFAFSAPLSRLIISDYRAALSVKILGVIVLFSGACSVIKGYFIARRKASPTAFSLIIEQFIRIAAVVLAIKFSPGSLTYLVAAVFFGDALAEIFSFLYLVLRYRSDVKRISFGDKVHTTAPVMSTLKISAPLAAGKYISQLLRTGENMLVPKALSFYSKSGALSLFGMIKGMALPVLFFPSAILSAVSTLLVPEMSEANVKRQRAVVRSAVERILSAATLVGVLFSAIFAVCGAKIGWLIYKSADVGFLITALSPIVPLMYIDSLCDGLLRGLDQQNFCFRVAVSDSAIRIILILIFVKPFGIRGFIGIMYFSNLLTCLLNVKRLIKISGAGIDAQKTVLIPVLSAFFVTLLLKLVLNFLSLSDLIYIILLCSIATAVYFFLLYYFYCINLDSVGRIRTHKKYAAKTTITSLTK